MSSIIFFISFVLEGILSLYIPFSLNDLNIYYPSLVLVSLVICYPIFKQKKKVNKYYVIIAIIGLLYDLVYTDILFLHSLLFLISGLIIDKYYSKFDINNYMFLLLCILVISNYNIVYYMLLVVFQRIDLSFYNLIYKIINSYFFNLLYGYILYILLSKYRNKLRLVHKK